VQLRRRYDLIPNLVATVRAYAAHESETLKAVVRARDGARSAATIEEQGEAESVLTGAIGRLLAIAEAYPELRSEKRFAELQEELTRTEDKISISRHIYNDTTLNYNDAVSTLPSSLIARLAGFSGRDYFQAEERSRHTPEVKM
jgi:LemA protein